MLQGGVRQLTLLLGARVLQFLEEDAADADEGRGFSPFAGFFFSVVLKSDGAFVGEVGDEGVIDEFFAVEDDGDVFF